MKPSGLVSVAFVALCHIYSTAALTHTDSHVATHVVRANLQVPSQLPMLNAPRSQGCFKSKGNMTEGLTGSTVSSGSCNAQCTKGGFAVIALQGSNCFCGNAYPPEDSLTDDSNCSYPCPAYGKEACGNLGQPGYFSVWNTGVNINPPYYQPPSTTTSATPTPTTPSADSGNPASGTATATGGAHSSSATSGPKKDDGPSVAGIVAGTVAGVAVVAGALGACFFVVRRRRNAEIEEEHRRTAAVNAFINGSKPPSTNGSISMTDARLDPILAHRRMSDGSIADNEDYSRRILRVTNA